MDDYAISVITPCHNVNMILLEKAFDSLKNQTCGFENIEWIVIIHNCVEKNAHEIEAMVAGYTNVKTYRLQNGKNRAASPRNYGLEKATGTYIGFLDADDYFETNTFEAVIKQLSESGAQLAVFRYEVVEKSPDLPTSIHPFMYLDQTREAIVLDHDKWDSSLFIHGEAMNLGAKIYRRSFLTKNAIRFDEEIPFAEEGKLHLQCYGNADKVCFLPQLIGYIYCRYGDSMVATLKNSPDVVMKYAQGFKKIFDCGLSHNLYMNTYMWDLLGYLSAVLLASMDLTYPQRKEIRDILKPYVERLKPLRESKAYTPSKIKLISTLVSVVLAHPGLIHSVMSLMKVMKIDMASKMDVQYD